MRVQPVAAALLLEVASRLRITDHLTGETSPWVPNQEQVRSWAEQERSPWYYILKARQIGETTGQCLVDVLFVAINAAAGHKVEVWLVWDKEENVKSKIDLCGDFCRQLGIEHRELDLDIEFPNGSAIRGFTAGGSRVGASRTCHRLHASELPNWPNANSSWTSLLQSLLLSSFACIETTMLIGNEGGTLAKALWEEPNQWAKVFHSVEGHAEYRLDPRDCRIDKSVGPPDPLEPEIRKWLEEEGCTSLETMAYMQYLLKNKIPNRDQIALLREYPVLPRHCFTLAQGRWIRCEPPVLEHRAELEGNEIIKIYAEPHETSGDLVMGVDSAGGTGRDRNAIGLIDRKDKSLVASYVDEWSTLDQLVSVAKRIQEMYTTESRIINYRRRPPRYPLAIIEKDGIGLATIQAAQRLGLIYEELKTTEATRYAGLAAVREQCEAGVLCGPLELSQEADELHTDEGKFKGKKDLCMAIGFAYKWMEENPLADETAPHPSHRADFASKLKRRRGTGWQRRL